MTLLRPKFNEGQVLSAGDLGRGVDYARYADAVHCRTQHTWGVVTGLTFRTVDQTTANGKAYKDVYLTPGIAIDPSGRRIVIDAEALLSTVQFSDLGVATANALDALYPVYVLGVDQNQAASSTGSCATNSPTRVAEGFQIDFGRPGSDDSVLKQTPVPFGNMPGTGSRVLVGYVAWDGNLAGGKFIGVNTASPTGAVRYAGVRAAEILAPAGSITLNTQDSGKRFALAITDDGQGGCKLEFGSRQDNKPISDVFSVNEKGDVTFSGKLDVKLPSVPVVESGVIYHGVRVPLPSGVTEAAITAKQFTAHVVVSPLSLGVLVRGTSTFYPVPLACRVDKDRRVVSKVMWRNVDPTKANYFVAPVACQYLVVASPSS